MKESIFEAMESSPLIPAVKNDEGLGKSLTCDQRVIFVLYGDICGIRDIVREIRQHGKLAIVHADLIAGLGSKEAAVDYLHQIGADGIISTRPGFIKRGRELGLFTIHRFFVFDSLSLQNVAKGASISHPDIVEILPGLMPKVIARVCQAVEAPVICGGLIEDKNDVMAALGAGAMAISTTDQAVWDL